MRAVIWGLLLEMLLKTGGNCETNTYKTLDLLQHNNITQECTTHHLFVAILVLTLLHLFMAILVLTLLIYHAFR